VTAHDAKTGKELWRTRTIPAPGEPGNETWGDVPFGSRKHVGAWMVPSYDPELNLVYFGTSVTSPAPKFMLGGTSQKHLYHNCTLALDGNTGKIVWYYQHLIDHWDFDHAFERLLLDTAVRPDPAAVSWINPKLNPGEVRKVITGIPGKTGIVYTLDRRTGEFLWARPTVRQNVVRRIDGGTGAVEENPETIFTAAGQELYVCPGQSGGKNWTPGAYSPLTRLMYFPLANTCELVKSLHEKPVSTSLYSISYQLQLAPGTENVGAVHAISPETGRTAWKYEQRAAVTALLSTGGRLLFFGDENGRFRALDQETGKSLWEVMLGSPVTGHPITYAVEGKQFVAVSTGGSLNTGRLNRLAPEVRPSQGNTLFVFALP
jgi:alcohol dehydrogenase (cytochrome c)